MYFFLPHPFFLFKAIYFKMWPWELLRLVSLLAGNFSEEEVNKQVQLLKRSGWTKIKLPGSFFLFLFSFFLSFFGKQSVRLLWQHVVCPSTRGTPTNRWATISNVVSGSRRRAWSMRTWKQNRRVDSAVTTRVTYVFQPETNACCAEKQEQGSCEHFVYGRTSSLSAIWWGLWEADPLLPFFV